MAQYMSNPISKTMLIPMTEPRMIQNGSCAEQQDKSGRSQVAANSGRFYGQ